MALPTLALIFLLIAVRQVGRVRLQIWQVMCGGAVVMLLGRAISPGDAWRAIDWRVIGFLACMFAIGRAMEESGYLEQLASALFRRARSSDAIVLLILFGLGGLSALLMNDTIAIVGVPVVLMLAKAHRMSAKLLLLTLAFAVTIGSIPSPIGNPQNLLIAFQVANPFVAFARHLALPSVVALLGTYGTLRLLYAREFHRDEIVHLPAELTDASLAASARVSLILVCVLIAAKVLLVYRGIDLSMLAIAGIGVVPVLLHRRRESIVRTIDWATLFFFAGMFIVMDAVWRAGEVQHLVRDVRLDSKLAILLTSIGASQLISNVPLVALLLPLLKSAPQSTLLTLAAGSTLAGNLLILGAASNVIIIQQAERRGETLGFVEFARAGVCVTIVCVAVFLVL